MTPPLTFSVAITLCLDYVTKSVTITSIVCAILLFVSSTPLMEKKIRRLCIYLYKTFHCEIIVSRILWTQSEELRSITRKYSQCAYFCLTMLHAHQLLGSATSQACVLHNIQKNRMELNSKLHSIELLTIKLILYNVQWTSSRTFCMYRYISTYTLLQTQ